MGDYSVFHFPDVHVKNDQNCAKHKIRKWQPPIYSGLICEAQKRILGNSF